MWWFIGWVTLLSVLFAAQWWLKRQSARLQKEIEKSDLLIKQLDFWQDQLNAALVDYMIACERGDDEGIHKAYERAQLADRRFWQEANR